MKRSYAIIGAGPSGLACAKVFLDMKINFQGYEASENVSGLWNIDSPTNRIYPNLHLISSRKKTEFRVFPMQSAREHFPHYIKIYKYLNRFADAFDLRSHFTFGVRVVLVEKESNGKWRVDLSNGETAYHDGIIIAIGTCNTPNLPDFDGDFAGDIKHSKDVKDFSFYKDKSVLVIGAGNSGSDMACELSRIAKNVGLSMNRGNYIIPKYIMGRPADQSSFGVRFPPSIKQFIHQKFITLFYGDPVKFGMPKPDFKIYERHPVINSQLMYQIGHGHIIPFPKTIGFNKEMVLFSNGERHPFDAIILATGYKIDYPFIDRKYLNWGAFSPELYLNIFNPSYREIFVLGMVESLGLGWEGRYQQAKIIGQYLVQKEKGSTKALLFDDKMQFFPALNGGYKYEKSAGMSYYVHNRTYMKHLKHGLRQLRFK